MNTKTLQFQQMLAHRQGLPMHDTYKFIHHRSQLKLRKLARQRMR
jgi:hypothetical protein